MLKAYIIIFIYFLQTHNLSITLNINLLVLNYELLHNMCRKFLEIWFHNIERRNHNRLRNCMKLRVSIMIFEGIWKQRQRQKIPTVFSHCLDDLYSQQKLYVLYNKTKAYQIKFVQSLIEWFLLIFLLKTSSSDSASYLLFITFV